MRLTERQARTRLGEAVAKAGGQHMFARSLNRPSQRAAESMVSKSLRGPGRISPPILDALGMSRDECGDIHTVEPACIQVLAVHAEGDAGVQAAAALAPASSAPGPDTSPWRRGSGAPSRSSPKQRIVR